jgi:cell pole-organizing protein PopZ
VTAAPASPGSPNAPGAPGGGADPSMEEILASIRRILSEDEEAAPAQAHDPGTDPLAMPEGEPDVLSLDTSMLVEETLPPPPTPSPRPEPARAEPTRAEPTRAEPTRAATPSPAAKEPPMTPPGPDPFDAAPAERPEALLAPEAAAAAASSVGSLLRTLASERQQVAVTRGGPTIEDLVREEIRPVLKIWLDANLPSLVERLVRAEIERVVGRALS